MFAKKLTASLAVVAALALSAPAFADRGYHGGHGHGYGHGHRHVQRVVVHKPHYVVHRPAVVHHYYHRPAPRPVYVVQQHHHVNPVAVLAGAVIGAAIVHHVVTGY